MVSTAEDVAGLISIHAPREGSDFTPSSSQPAQIWISIHAPREGSDPIMG